MKKGLIVSTILAFVVTANLYAQTKCEEVPEGIELSKSLESKMYDQAEVLMETFKLEIENYRDNCDSSQDMFEQTEISILTYEDQLADLKKDLKISNTSQAIDCTKIPSVKKLDSALKTGIEKEIEKSYEAYKKDSESYLNHCTLHEEYIVIFEETASYDDYYGKWKKDLNI